MMTMDTPGDQRGAPYTIFAPRGIVSARSPVRASPHCELTIENHASRILPVQPLEQAEREQRDFVQEYPVISRIDGLEFYPPVAGEHGLLFLGEALLVRFTLLDDPVGQSEQPVGQ